MYEKIKNKEVVKHHRISREPWLHDKTLSDEERMMWKMKDDCPFSDVQLSFAYMERELYRTSSLEHLNTEELAKHLGIEQEN